MSYKKESKENFLEFIKEEKPFLISEILGESEGFIVCEKYKERTYFATIMFFDSLDQMVIKVYSEINCKEEYRIQCSEYLELTNDLDDGVSFEIDANGSIHIAAILDYKKEPLEFSDFFDVFTSLVFRFNFFMNPIEKVARGRLLKETEMPEHIIMDVFESIRNDIDLNCDKEEED